MTPLDTALSYCRRGWNPVPIPHRAKGPLDKEWHRRRIDEAEAPRFFNGAAMNIGVALGPTSAGLTDVDLDCAEAIALAPYLLPRTGALFGRPGKPSSHRLYVTDLAGRIDKGAIRHRDPERRALVELRVGGGERGAQTVFPGSTHESGEAIRWEQDGEPATVDGPKLQRAVAALAAGCLLVRGWPDKGGRHDAALVVGGVLARAGWGADEARHLVGAVAQAAGCADVKAKGDAAASAVKGLADGTYVYGFPALVEFFGEPVAAKVAEWVGFKADDRLGRMNDRARERAEAEETVAAAADLDGGVVTQDGVARAFAARFAGKLRFDHHAGSWHEWTGTHWRRDERDRAFQHVRALGREMGRDGKDAVRREVGKVQFAGGVERMARGDEALAVTTAEWDRDPFLLGTPGGTVDLRTGELRAADPAEGITKLTAAAPAATAECPRWLRFLDETFGGDEEVIRFVQRWAGYGLTGDVSEHALVFGSGAGGNGKSVLVNTLSGVMGEYATAAAMDTFAASTFDKHTTDLAMLRGARLVTASETEEGRVWAEARIKQLTGGDPITARFMRQDNFTFRPTFKLFVVGNHQPVLRNVDDAMRRRLNILPFDRRPAEPDRELEAKLKAEWPGILRWMIDGCLAWQANGLGQPGGVAEATASYFDNQDLLGEWLETECVVDKGNRARMATSQDLFNSWHHFAKANNEEAGSQTVFGDNLRKRGFTPDKNVPAGGGKRARGFRGIELRRDSFNLGGNREAA
jgi:P4 family phage/plasmid primase-like protien